MIRIGVFALVLTVVLASSSLASAQFLWIGEATVASGMVAQYEETTRQVIDAYRQTGAGPQTVLIYQTAMGSNQRTYYVVAPFNTWSDIDGWRVVPQVVIEAYGPEEGAEILGANDASVMTREHRVTTQQADFTSAPPVDPGAPRPPFFQVITTQIDPALSDDYFLFLAKLKEAEEAAGVLTGRSSTAQGPLNEYTAIRSFNSYAELDSWQNAYELLTDYLGATEADPLIQRQLQAVRSRSIHILAYRPDLSLIPEN